MNEAPQRSWIAYVGPVTIPDGGAAARRILGTAHAMVASGRDVVIVSGQPPAANGSDWQVAPGIRCVCVNERDAEHLPKFLRYLRYAAMGMRTRAWLESQPVRPEAIVVYSGYSPYLLHLRGWARRHNVRIIFDAVEWYTASTLLKFIASPYHWNIELAMRTLIPRTDGVLTISRALEQYYLDRGLPVLRVPPLLDMSSVPHNTRSRAAPLKLIYAGNPGRKDRLNTIVEGVLAADAGQQLLELNIAGLSESEVKKLPALAAFAEQALPACLVVHGRLAHAQVQELIAQCDFSVLLRPVNRVSTCGFPTKFVESLAQGTPAIANITGDLGEHLRDGQTGLVCEGNNSEVLQKSLARALNMSLEDRQAMSEKAREEAARSFDYRQYVAGIDSFLNGLRQKHALGQKGN